MRPSLSHIAAVGPCEPLPQQPDRLSMEVTVSDQLAQWVYLRQLHFNLSIAIDGAAIFMASLAKCTKSTVHRPCSRHYWRPLDHLREMGHTLAGRSVASVRVNAVAVVRIMYVHNMCTRVALVSYGRRRRCAV